MLHLETVEHSGKPAWQNYPVTPERVAKAYVLLAFISGFVLYHAIGGELPTTFKRSSLAFFVLGAVFYAVLLIGRAIIRA